MSKKLSRRDFLKISGSSAALAASSLPLSGLLRAAPYRQDITNIVFGGWGATAEDNGVQAAIAEFEKLNSDIKVQWQLTPQAADYMQQLLTNVAAGTAPDASFITSDAYETLASGGQLLDITDQITSDPELGQADYFFPQEAVRCADDDGRWHGIGSTWVAAQTYYNADLFDKAGITPPGFKDEELWNWDTFIENAKQLTVDANGRHPDDAGFDPDNIQQWAVDWPLGNFVIPVGAVYSNGGEWIKDGKVVLDSPEAMEALQKLADLVYVHHVAPRTAAMSDLGMTNTQMVDSGRLAMAIDGSWALSWMNPSTMTNVKLGTGAIPYLKKPADYMQAHFHSVLSSSQHPEEAWKFVRFLATPFYTLSFMKIGLWLPSQMAQVTPDGLKTWLTEGVHPANYADFVTDYLPKHGVVARIPAGYIEANNNFLVPAIQAIADGTPVEEVMPDAVKNANDVIAAAQ
ncbi:MAG TPA: sugar ABC transporter substrate-binding protein [Phototrophicaceae bacterium]|nr:sugar ABC transporter substrate-binding protein [Phototrophicaceae bacterium]